MKALLIHLTVKWEKLKDENGQDLIEYSFLVALLALSATAGMKTIASDLNGVCTHIGSLILGA
ncbi:MAG TPA: Flp family type IVb pilin [Acidobacteriaceae bacterium]|jgi:pilus assembly protein Flp/PilA|nr:Flp family type IVb pilin [Acidobacteriaceae bacterium]